MLPSNYFMGIWNMRIFYIICGAIFSLLMFGGFTLLKSNDYDLKNIYHYQMKPIYSQADYRQKIKKKRTISRASIKKRNRHVLSISKASGQSLKPHSRSKTATYKSQKYSALKSNFRKPSYQAPKKVVHNSYSANHHANALKAPLNKPLYQAQKKAVQKTSLSTIYSNSLKPPYNKRNPIVIIPDIAALKNVPKSKRYHIARWQGIALNDNKKNPLYVARLKSDGPVLFRAK